MLHIGPDSRTRTPHAQQPGTVVRASQLSRPATEAAADAADAADAGMPAYSRSLLSVY
jgi:hypothetical protein